MPCADVEARLDAFVDSELSPREQIDVARHLARCPGCNAVVERVPALRSSLASMAEVAVESMSLARVWPAVSNTIDGGHRGRWAWPGERRVPARGLPMWAAGMAMAAGALLVLRAVQPTDAPITATTVASLPPRSSVVIERVSGPNIDVRRDRKSGATIILVNHAAEVRAR